MADCPYQVRRGNLQAVREQVQRALCDIDERINSGGGGGGAGGVFDCGFADTVYADDDANIDCGSAT